MSEERQGARALIDSCVQIAPSAARKSGALTDRPNLRLLPGGGGGFWNYLDEMKVELGVAAVAEPLLPATLLPILEAAERGEVVWSESVVKYPMKLAPDVGELIVNVERRQYRLYFAEPPKSEGLMLALKFGHKHGADWRRLQNSDIREAGRRLKAWQNSQCG